MRETFKNGEKNGIVFRKMSQNSRNFCRIHIVNFKYSLKKIKYEFNKMEHFLAKIQIQLK